MNDPLFQHADGPLSSEEEAEITQKLAEAYKQSQNNEKRPEFKRIAEAIQKNLHGSERQIIPE